MGVDRLLGLLRGRKVFFHLVGGSTSLVEPALYPFRTGEVPVLFDRADGPGDDLDGYTSGLRSIVRPGVGDLWFKAKAIGIPSGSSRPICVDGNIYTYYLSEAFIGTGRLIWGFSTVDEAENEISRMVEARELGLPAAKPVGLGYYSNIRVLDYRDRVELFKMLDSTPRESLLERFRGSSRPVEAACVFTAQPTDVRADEVLYGFLHPLVLEVLDPRDCRDFLGWLGSCCGLNLRMHHDAGILHGTVPRYGGFMTNSHTANHLVDEEGTYTTDYHMAYRSGDKDLKRVEVFFLASLMNPLPRAEEAAGEAFRQDRPLLLELPVENAFPISYGKYQDQFFRPRGQCEKFTEAFIDGVAHGYNRRKVRHVEAKLRREALLKSAACKKELFRLLGFPEGMERGSEHVAKRLAGRSFTDGELRESLGRIEEDLR
jgi:hypothetical protein